MEANGVGVALVTAWLFVAVGAGGVFVPGADDAIGATVGGVLLRDADAEADGVPGIRVASGETVAPSIVGRLVVVTVTMTVPPGIAFAGGAGGTTMMIGGATVVIVGGGMTDGEDTGSDGTDGTGVSPAGAMSAPLVAVASGWADGVSEAGLVDVAGMPDEVSGVPTAAGGVAIGVGVSAIGESAVGVGAPTDAPPAVTGMAAVAGVAGGMVGVSSVGGVAVGIVGKARGGDAVGNPTAR